MSADDDFDDEAHARDLQEADAIQDELFGGGSSPPREEDYVHVEGAHSGTWHAADVNMGEAHQGGLSRESLDAHNSARDAMRDRHIRDGPHPDDAGSEAPSVFPARGHAVFFSGAPQVRPGSAQGDAPRGSNTFQAADPNMPHNQGRGGQYHNNGENVECHVRQMPGFPSHGEGALNGAALLGDGIKPVAPLFRQGDSSSSGWVSYALSGLVEKPITPARAMCFNIPAECFMTDASKFNEWQTPMKNSVRAASIAALVGMVATPLSKGFPSGEDEEKARGEQDGDQPGNVDKKPKRITRWMMKEEGPGGNSMPMFVTAIEDIYDSSKTNIVALRVWHFVFDHTHSTSHLARKLMQESADESDHSGAAHCPNFMRKQSNVTTARQMRGLVGSSLETAALEEAAGLLYRHVTSESVYKNLLPHYAGHCDKSPGRPAVDLSAIPPGAMNTTFLPSSVFGCWHPLAFEWVFNAKREEALCAGLVHLDGTPMDVHPDQLHVDSYFDMSIPATADDSHVFSPPEFVATPTSAGGKGCFFFQTDPYQVNVFDMTLPHPITGSIKPGPELMALYKERFHPEENINVNSLKMLSLFNNTMTGQDQWMRTQINALKDTIVNFDTMDTTTEQRMDVKAAKRAISRGIANYGQMDGESHVIEPRQVIKEHAYTTGNVHSKLIAPWVSEMRAYHQAEEERLRSENDEEHRDTDFDHEHFDLLRGKRNAFQAKYKSVVSELVKLHLAKLERSFNSRMDKESIPAGYRAVWDGLMKELEDMPNRTANVAYGIGENGMQMTDSDRTLFGQLTNWIGVFFEDDCFVDGRDWRLMQELFYHCFEQFGEQTLLLIFCGPKGNGKTLRTERAMKAFVEGWITMSGPSSAKSGMQGNSDSHNGSNCIYDEMIDELTDGDGSNRTEYWKMILLKREYVYNKPVVVKGSDGREMHKTFKLRTPHQETHCVCTNRGPAFTKGKEEPSEVKSALIDRAVVQFVRTLGSKTHDDAEFERHIQHTDVRRKVKQFRILTCLMGLVKIMIYRLPFLRPDTALAQKMWDQWDTYVERDRGLPRPTPRKNIKRLETLVTMTVMNAVGHVFMTKQTCHNFPAGQVTEEFPKGKPFELSMLADVVPLLQPTREMIHMAWTMGLEYSIGTSSMGLNTMTVLAEMADRHIGDRFCRQPTGEISSYLQSESHLTDLQHQTEAEEQARKTAAEGGTATGASGGGGASRAQGATVRAVLNAGSRSSGGTDLAGFERLFKEPGSTLSADEIKSLEDRFNSQLTMRANHQYNCSRSAQQNMLMDDAVRLIDDSFGASMRFMDLDPTLPPRDETPSGRGTPADEMPHREGGASAASPMMVDLSTAGGAFVAAGPMGAEDRGREPDEMSENDYSREEQGRRLWQVHHQQPGEVSPGDREVFDAYHRARSDDLPGHEHCAFIHPQTPEEMRECIYCCTDVEAQEDQAAADQAAQGPLSKEVSLTFFDAVEATSFYKCQTLVQFACGEAAYIDGCPELATRGFGIFGFRQKNPGSGGARRLDIGWLVCNLECAKTWHGLAEYIKNRGNRTVMEFDFHTDGLRDCLYLCSTRDNARRCPEEPRLISTKRPEKALTTADAKPLKPNTVVVKVAPYSIPGMGDRLVGQEHEHRPRHPESGVEDTFLQRRLDSLQHGGRLCALNLFASNRIVNIPPIRMSETLELNTGALFMHLQLVCWSIMTCALIPGLKNRQELFSNNQPGPDGLSAPTKRHGGGPLSGSKRTADSSVKDSVHTLPYSYDVVGISLGIKTMQMMYNEASKEILETNQDECEGAEKAHMQKITIEDMPQLSLRFVGYDEQNRQTLSLKLACDRPEGQKYIEAGDPYGDESNISTKHVERSLGRKVGTEEMLRYISRRQGARSMCGVTGDLFAYQTWQNHCMASLTERGLCNGEDDNVVYSVYSDIEHCLTARVLEFRGSTRDDAGSMYLATPGTYSACEKREAIQADEQARKQPMKRQVHAMRKKVGKTKLYIPPVPGDRAPAPAQPAAAGPSGGRARGDVIRVEGGPQRDD